jgi:hypothetical protein
MRSIPQRWTFVLIGAIGCAAATVGTSRAIPDVDTREWIQLFNGRDLADWSARVPGQALGENVSQTFRVDSAMIRIGPGRGFLFYTRRPFSHYSIVVEYRFRAGDVTEPKAALVIHSEPPDSMGRDQQRPVGLELGLTAYSGGQWARVEAIVLGDSVLHQVVEGDTVVSAPGPKPFAQGYIALEAKGARVDVRKVELLNLEGCPDPDALTYKPYSVKPDSLACFYAAPR